MPEKTKDILKNSYKYNLNNKRDRQLSGSLFGKHRLKNKVTLIFPLFFYNTKIYYTMFNHYNKNRNNFYPLHKYCLYAKNFLFTPKQVEYLNYSDSEQKKLYKANTRLNCRTRMQVILCNNYFNGIFIRYHNRFNYSLGIISLCLAFIKNGYNNNRFSKMIVNTINYDFISDSIHFKISTDAKNEILKYVKYQQEIPKTKYLNELYDVFLNELELQQSNLYNNIRLKSPWISDNYMKGGENMDKISELHYSYENKWVEIYGRKNKPEELRIIQLVEDALKHNILTYDVPIKKFNKRYVLSIYKNLVEINKNKSIQELLNSCPSNYKLINYYTDFLSFYDDLENETLISIDTETTGLLHSDRIVGISIYLESKAYAVYIPIRHKTENNQIECNLVINKLKPIFESEKVKKILHNAKFDYHMLAKEGIYLKGIFVDTMIGMHLVNENLKSYALKNIATYQLEIESDSFNELFGSKFNFSGIDLDVANVYACKDVDLTYKLYKHICNNFEKEPFLWDANKLEIELMYVLIEIENNGMSVDFETINKNVIELEKSINNLNEELMTYLEIENINSTLQLQEALNRKGIFKNNEKSTAKDVLLKYKDNEIIQKILLYKKQTKLLNTYYKPIHQFIRDKRLYCNFNQIKTVTGRLSSSNPNMQNIPPEARTMFIAPPNKLLLSLDYKQQEVRYMAHISNDKGLQQPFIDGIDLYSALASQVFKKPLDECGDKTKYRNIMKTCIIALMYGMSNKTLAVTLNQSIYQINELMDKFKSNYPDMFNFISDTERKVMNDGYVIIDNIRKRHFYNLYYHKKKIDKIDKFLLENLAYIPKNIYNCNALSNELKHSYIKSIREINTTKRQSVNAIIQGSCAIMTKKALIKVYNLLKSYGNDYKIISTVHDEILLEVPETITSNQIEEIKNTMSNVVDLKVDMLVDAELMKVWH